MTCGMMDILCGLLVIADILMLWILCEMVKEDDE